jgi:DNA-binding NtrC family response regulator
MSIHHEAAMSAARVLIVDDEKSMRELLTITLEKAGYDVTAAEGGEAAIEAIRKDSFDAIVTDLQRALERTHGVQTKAAELLRMTLRQFRYKVRKHNLARRTVARKATAPPAPRRRSHFNHQPC